MSYGQPQDSKKKLPGQRPNPPSTLKSTGPAKRTLPSGTSPPPVVGSARRQSSEDDAEGGEYSLQSSEPSGGRDAPADPPMPAYTRWVREPVVTADPLPDPPAWPFLSGVFSFPFYLQAIGVWMLIGMGLTVGGLGLVLCTWCLDQGLTLAFRCFVLPVFFIIAFSCSYASAACLVITQVTSDGYDGVDDWPTGDWREWAWSMTYTAGMFVLALMIAWGIQALVPYGWPIPLLGSIIVFYPILLLSALESGSPANPISKPVLESLLLVWWAWLIVIVESAVMLGAWLLFTVLAFQQAPWLAPVLAAPLLAAGLMIYARLLGRLAWKIDQTMAQRRARDEDE